MRFILHVRDKNYNELHVWYIHEVHDVVIKGVIYFLLDELHFLLSKKFTKKALLMLKIIH